MMSPNSFSYGNRLLRTLHTALIGPQLLAFVPAITLGGYWYGGEGVLLFLAIVLPALLGLLGLFSPSSRASNADAARDPITGLPFRDTVITALDRGFAAEAETGARCAAMVLEIDEFDQYQAQYGNDATDHILNTVANRIRDVMRQADSTCRLEKAIFAIALCPAQRSDVDSIIQICSRLQNAIAEPLTIDGMRLFLTVSIGFCLPRQASERTGEACLEAAESALQEAQTAERPRSDPILHSPAGAVWSKPV